MATAAERVEALRLLLGVSKNQFTQRIKLKSRSTYTNWTSGSQAPDRDTEEVMSTRWQVSLDSLRGKPGTYNLEPSPALRAAQDQLLIYLSASDTPGTPAGRLALVWSRLSELVPDFPLEGWLEWLQWSEADWNMFCASNATPGALQLEKAAFVLGWYHGKDMWHRWLQTGFASELAPFAERQVRIMAQLLLRRRDAVEWRRLLSE